MSYDNVLVLPQRSAEVLNAIKRLRGLTDAEIAARSGLSRASVDARRRGVKLLDVDDLERLGQALNVDPAVFLMDTLEAMRWLLDNAPELDGPRNQDELRRHEDPR